MSNTIGSSSVTDNFRPLYDDWFGEDDAPLLFRAINLGSWDLCRQLLSRSHQIVCNELTHVDPYGYSALHYASWWPSSPPDIFEKIVDCSPRKFPSLPNRKGRTPLHLAAWRGSDESVIQLALKRPEAASVTDRNQKSPLADACSRNRSKRVIEALLKADYSQVAEKTAQDLWPALIFFRISHGFVSAPHRTRFSQQSEQRCYKDKVRLILAADRRTAGGIGLCCLSDLKDDWQLLIASIESISCPFSFVKVMLDRLHAEIPTYQEEDGNTLLHLAVQSHGFSYKRFFKCDRCNRQPALHQSGEKAYFNRDPQKSHRGVRCCHPDCSFQGQNLSFHYVQVPLVIKERAVVQYILRQHPNLASIANSSGKLPIELALTSRRTWQTGIQELVMANPHCLSRVDNAMGLYPFQLAALPEFPRTKHVDSSTCAPPEKKQKRCHLGGSGGSTVDQDQDHEQVDTIYQLLRHSPSLVLP
eukprot:scaffold627_cov125-Cylindrotheca_fusiformis.AAC.22